MKHPKKNKRLAQRPKSKLSLSQVVFTLFVLFITIFATVAFVQQSLEMRQFAQVNPNAVDPTPTIIPEMTPEPDPTNTPVPDPTKEPTPLPTAIPEPTAITPTTQNPQPTTTNPSPTDEPTPTTHNSQPSTITPTPIYRCNVSCTGNDTCPKNLFCANGVCRNPSCSKESDCDCTLPTNTPRPVVYTSPKKTVSPTVKMPQVITPTIAFLADKGDKVTPRPTPDFEIFKVPDPPKKSVLQLIIGFIADAFCKVFGC